MPPRSPRAAAARQARLYREAERLAERFRARLSADDIDAAGDELIRRRAALLEEIRTLDLATAATGDGEESARRVEDGIAAVGRMIEQNRELVALLEAEKARVRHQLATIGESRHALASYQGPMPLSPAFCDRVG